MQITRPKQRVHFSILLLSMNCQELYRKVQAAPEDATVWFDLGNCLREFGKLTECELCFLKATELRPSFSTAWRALAGVYFTLGHRTDAERCFRQAFELDGSIEAIYGIGIAVALDPSRAGEAEVVYRRILAMNDKFSLGWQALGNLLRDTKRYAEAEEAYRRCLAIDSSASSSWGSLGYILSLQVDTRNEAYTALRKAVELDPSFGPAWLVMATILADRPHEYAQQAEYAFRQAIKYADSRTNLGVAWHKLGGLLDQQLDRELDAVEAYTQSLVVNPNEILSWVGLGKKYCSIPGQEKKGIQAFQKAVSLGPGNHDLLFQWAISVYEIPDAHNEITEILRRTLGQFPNSLDAMLGLATILSAAGDTGQEAEALLKKVYLSGERQLSALIGLSNLLERQLGRRKEYIQVTREIILLDPTNFGAVYSLATALSENEDTMDEAEKLLLHATSRRKDDFRLYYGLGTLYNNLGRFEEAEMVHRKAIELDPKNARTWHSLSIALEMNGKLKESELACRKSIELDPNDALAHAVLASVLAHYPATFDEAERYALKAIELIQGSTKPVVISGVAYSFDQAKALAEPYTTLGMLYSHIKERHEDSEKFLKHAIRADQNFIAPYNTLGNLLADYPERLEEAERLFRFALTLTRHFRAAYLWCGLGGVIAKNPGRNGEAMNAYRNALRVKPDYAFVWSAIGSLQTHNGAYAEAIESFLKAIDLEKTDPLPFLGVVKVTMLSSLESTTISKEDPEIYLQKAVSLFDGTWGHISSFKNHIGIILDWTAKAGLPFLVENILSLYSIVDPLSWFSLRQSGAIDRLVTANEVVDHFLKAGFRLHYGIARYYGGDYHSAFLHFRENHKSFAAGNHCFTYYFFKSARDNFEEASGSILQNAIHQIEAEPTIEPVYRFYGALLMLNAAERYPENKEQFLRIALILSEGDRPHEKLLRVILKQRKNDSWKSDLEIFLTDGSNTLNPYFNPVNIRALSSNQPDALKYLFLRELQPEIHTLLLDLGPENLSGLRKPLLDSIADRSLESGSRLAFLYERISRVSLWDMWKVYEGGSAELQVLVPDQRWFEKAEKLAADLDLHHQTNERFMQVLPEKIARLVNEGNIDEYYDLFPYLFLSKRISVLELYSLQVFTSICMLQKKAEQVPAKLGGLAATIISFIWKKSDVVLVILESLIPNADRRKLENRINELLNNNLIKDLMKLSYLDVEDALREAFNSER